MTSPYLGQIMMFGGDFAPNGWALCNGAAMSYHQNAALYQLIGTTYGGNPEEGVFNLPNLQSQLPIHIGQRSGLSPYQLGQNGGAETVALTAAQMPAHNHELMVSLSAATATTVSGNLPAIPTGPNTPNYLYVTPPADGAPPQPHLWALNSGCVGITGGTSSGGTSGHSNMMPSLCITFCIALLGTYPPQP